MYQILVCDDDRDIVSALAIYLKGEGYGVLAARCGAEAVERVKAGGVDLVLMDIMMPGLDGIQATARIRELSNVPILFLTAKGEDTDKILGLNIGADDYITKPFSPLEVLARVRSQLRRYTRLGGQGGAPADAPGLMSAGPIVLDDLRKQVTLDGDPVSLTPLEYSILRLLIARPGQVFSTVQIYEQVWNDPALGSENTVAVHIRHLREKLEIDPAHPRYLKVVWGLGYKLEGGSVL